MILLLPVALAGCRQRSVQEPGPQRPELDVDRLPVAIDLVAALPFAVPRTETRVIDFGDPAARRHLVDGWSDDETFGPDEVTTVWGLGGGSTLWFEIFEPRELPVEFRCRPLHWGGGPRQELTVLVNGKQVERIRLRPGFREYRLTLPDDVLVSGRNLFQLEYGFSRTPRDLDPHSSDTRPLAVTWDTLRFGPPAVPEPPPAEDTILLPFGTEAAFFLDLPTVSYLALDAVETYGGRGRLIVGSRFDHPGMSAGSGAERANDNPYRWQAVGAGEQDVILALEGPRAGLAEITLRAISEDGTGGGILVRGPRLHHSLPEVTPAVTAVEPTALEDRRRPHEIIHENIHVIIYLVDTLRADHLGCYGYPKAVSPRIDAFAEEGILFERTLASSSWTRSAVASVLTGETPLRHGVLGRADALPPHAETLAETLRGAGYQTAGFFTNGNVSATFGFDQGFDKYKLLRRRSAAQHALSDHVNQEVSDWLGQRDDRPFFLYVHTIDPHAPYRPPASAAERFAADVAQPRLDAAETAALRAQMARVPKDNADGLSRLGSVPWMHALNQGQIAPTETITKDLIALYDAEIYFNDLNFGLFLDTLRELGLYDDSLIFFLSDHGEEFRDHGRWGHGQTLYGEQLRVPLIVKPPANSGGARGLRSQRLGQQIDIVPTVLRTLGLPIPQRIEGHDLLSQLDPAASGTDSRSGFSYLDLDSNRMAGLVSGRWKILCPAFRLEDCQLFDLEEDPRETTDLAALRPVIAGFLYAKMLRFVAQPGVESLAVSIDPELRKELEALGYL